MRRETLGGIALILGAIMWLVTMLFHPTGHQVMADPHGVGALGLAVHVLALLGVPVAFYGAFVLSRRLAQGGALSELALAFYGTGMMAAILAATASGLLAAGLMMQVAATEGTAREAAGAVLHYNGSLNQAFARVLVAATSLGILLWSIETLRTGLMRRATGVVGVAASLLALLALFSGHLRMDVHGFGAVVLGQAIWQIMSGVELVAANGRGQPAR